MSSDEEEIKCIMYKENKKTNVKKQRIFDDSSNSETEMENPIILKPKLESQNSDTDEKIQERYYKKAIEKEVKDVHKESQRIMREANISVPYHKPKQRTLNEFRKRKKSTPTISLHTSVNDLVIVWKAIEEKEKLVETFYRSESSSDDNGDDDGFNDKVKKIIPTSHDNNSIIDNVQPDFREQIFSCSNISTGNENGRVETTLSNEMGHQSLTLSNETNLIVNKVHNVNNSESVENSSELKVLTDENNIVLNNNHGIIQDLINKNCTTAKNSISVNSDMSSNVIKHSLVTISNPAIKENEGNNNSFNVDSSSVSVDQSNVTEEQFSLKLSESPLDYQSRQKDLKYKVNDGGDESSMFEINKKMCLAVPTVKDNINNLVQDIDSTDIVGEVASILKLKEDVSDLNKFNNLTMHCKEPQPNQCNKSYSNLISTNSQDESIRNDCSKIYVSDEHLKKPTSEISKLHSYQNIIDFDEEIKTSKFNSLLKRFYTHLTYKPKIVKKDSLLQLSVNWKKNTNDLANPINEEKSLVLVGINDIEDASHVNKPGAKLAQLKVHLKSVMAREREEEWVKKQKDHHIYEEEIIEEKKNDFEEDKQISIENNYSESDSQSSDTEEEEVDIAGSRRKSNMFIDDEAEESENSDNDECDKYEHNESVPQVLNEGHEIIGKNKKTAIKEQGLNVFCYNKALESDYDEELPSYQEPLPLGEKGNDLGESENSSPCLSPAFRLTALEGKDETNSYHCSEPSTPSNKLFICLKSVTPVGTLHQLVDRSPFANSQELEDLCSGQFVTQSLAAVEDNTSQDFNSLVEDCQKSQDPPTQDAEFTCRSETSQGMRHSHSRPFVEDDNEYVPHIKNRNVKKLTFSDDDNSDNDEEINKDWSYGMKGDTVNKKTYINDLGCNTENNSAVEEAEDFLEKEAELSESEWDSEDEDEIGLDTLEMEEADREQIDHKKLKQQLNQIHMKQLLLEDKKEVKILQEMLLEDGELHSDGKRQRFFRWSNNAFNEGSNTALQDSDEDKTEEDDEETWRRWRHEREQFLRKHTNNFDKMELLVDESENNVLNLGQKPTRRRVDLSKRQELEDTSSDILKERATKQSHQPSMKRGSFLTRGSKILSRLAQSAANGSESTSNIPKNTRNFVFTCVSPSKDCEQDKILDQETRKRKMSVLPLPIAKKPCVLKPKVGNKKSLFDALFNGHARS